MKRCMRELSRVFQMTRARIGLLLIAVGFPLCWYFSGVTLENQTLDLLLPLAGCALALCGASQISRCIIAIRMENQKDS